MSIPWNRLKSLREIFLAETAQSRHADYWEEEALLAAYDDTFAQRIGWKWQSVLMDLKHLQWQPPPARFLLDWGCGSAIATRVALGSGLPFPRQVYLWDRSRRAISFATQKISESFPDVRIEAGTPDPTALSETILLISHVLNELSPAAKADLLKLADQGVCVIWVEPGTKKVAQELVSFREKLTKNSFPVAPCPHSGPCGLLTPENQRHWCHHFAWPPQEAFNAPKWGAFSRELGIDLRSLPISYLVLDKTRKNKEGESTRVIGRPRHYKGYSLVLSCRNSGVKDERVLHKKNPALLEALEEKPFPRILSKDQWR